MKSKQTKAKGGIYMEEKKYISDIIMDDDVARWKAKDIVIISAGTGRGKSYFVKNNLYRYAKQQHKKILFLIHRVNCVTQFQNEIIRDKKEDTIDILTYQKVQSDVVRYGKHIRDEKYAYIVCDEFHYFISDAGFNNTTDISLDEVLKCEKSVKIFMSATGVMVENYLSNHYEGQICKYELPPDYSYVSSLHFFQHDEDVYDIANAILSANKKGIIFMQNLEKACKIFRKYQDKSLFNCSKQNKHYKHYVDENKIEQMLENECFEENLLITTSCFDAGVNIVDKDVRFIIVDMLDIDSLIQCLGRKRSQSKEDKVHFFIKAINNQQLSGFVRTMRKDIEMAEYLLAHGTQKLVSKYPRECDKSRIIYDDIVSGREDVVMKKVNMLMLERKKSTIQLFTALMKTDFGYCKYIAEYLGFRDKEGQYTYWLYSKDHSLETFLKKYVDENIVMLTVKDRKDLIDKMNIRKGGRQLKSIDSLNAALVEMRLPYRIESFSTSRITETGKKKNYKAAWRIAMER